MIHRIVLLFAVLLVGGCQSASTDGPSPQAASALAYAVSEASADPRYASLVVDMRSGETLHAANADAPRYPASLAKLMTLFILFEEIESGRLGLDSQLIVSPEAARQPPSKIGLKAGSTIRVRDAILALCVKSGNDVAVAVAENIAGSEAAFAARMSREASALGMRGTIFRNASGLPDPAQVTTARDMALLARAIKTRFPQYATSFGTRSFSYAGKTYTSTNELLGAVPGVDGMKTGYTRASGFNLVTTVERGGRRLIVVVMGEQSNASRNAHVASLIDAYMPERTSWLIDR